jgi:xanthine dehydrogenase accessory factor
MFATTDRFAAGVDVRRADFETDPFAGVRIDRRSYVALVTRGHRWDFDCLRRLLTAGLEPRYIGMIGSRRRVRAALGALLRAGYSREALSRVVAPIGLDIGAETPEEIAVAIAAELVLVRRGGEAVPRSAQERVLERLLRKEEPDARS